MWLSLFDISNIAFTVPLQGFGTDSYAVSWLELWATILGLASVIGAGMNKLWWYPVGILNSIGFICIFYQIQLYSDLLLNFYFIALSLYGWFIWTRRKLDGSQEFPIRFRSLKDNLNTALMIALLTYALGTSIDLVFSTLAESVAWVLGTSYTHTPAAMPYWDAFTTVSSLYAMYLLARRYVESWILWVIVDIVCIGLYMYKGVIAMAAEYTLFLLNAIIALYFWAKTARKSL